MIDKILGLMAPHRCYGCLTVQGILCPSCYDDIITDDFGRCAWCLKPTSGSNQCRECAARIGTSGTWVLGERSDALKRLVGNYKYESAREAGGVLTNMLSEKVAHLPPETVVCAVPTINAHIRQRGFDHAALLAKRFAGVRNLDYSPLLGRRTQLSQHELKGAARRKAAREAFTLKTTPVPKTVMLIDDILTTGATLEACVRLLREAGTEQVYVGVIARQPLK